MSTPHPEGWAPTATGRAAAQSLIDRVAGALAGRGASCGHCCAGECGDPQCPVVAAGWRGCPDCADHLRRLALGLLVEGLLAIPGEEPPPCG
ncbi:hypothetical protein CSPHI_04935 [Corynebacterium sphenisci DSM 44792]|uniref:Uncharacterized protein n=1 Tax=Corynebacterium sphenisci DSM 44792 TaxID=1437874 RepID=A0A1L7CXE2_9CORY|nr:hypothetical protein [Corynebacterium sphenisci]APT90490.1 hypothetical protein CSPHI_04935 [Corynebacterium sphenisci DSM 44792]